MLMLSKSKTNTVYSRYYPQGVYFANLQRNRFHKYNFRESAHTVTPNSFAQPTFNLHAY